MSHTFLLYTLTCLALVAAPGPDNLLAIARGLSQGKRAAAMSALASGCAIFVHVTAASLGLTALLQASATAFLLVKLAGGCYLVYLGWQAIRHRTLVRFSRIDPLPLWQVFRSGFLSGSLNPKVGIFIMAFVPQFIGTGQGSVAGQMMLLGGWFALLTTLGFGLMGISASHLARWIAARPRLIAGLNISAGLAFIAAGLSVGFAKAAKA